MILPHAALILLNADGSGHIAIRVTNFPKLSVDDNFEAHLKQDVCFHLGKIKSYTGNDHVGVKIEMELEDQAIGATWEEIAKLCVPDPSHYCELLYPRVIDCGVKYPTEEKE